LPLLDGQQDSANSIYQPVGGAVRCPAAHIPSQCVPLSWRAWLGLASPKELAISHVQNKRLLSGEFSSRIDQSSGLAPLLGAKKLGSGVGRFSVTQFAPL
jgi:hypothetical protein